MLHENTSNFSEQRFTSRFTGTEFFIKDHQVKGEKVLPGVGYLEIARAAIERSSAGREESTTIALKNMNWVNPVLVNGVAKEVHIGLFDEGNGKVLYEVYSKDGNEEEAVVHFLGEAEFKVKRADIIDIDKLQSEMTRGMLSGSACYQTLKTIGIERGSSYQGIQEIYQGENQAIAKLSLPVSVTETQHDYVLHPSVMDSALQAAVGLMRKGSVFKPDLAYSMESLDVLAPCTASMYAWLRYSGESSQSEGAQNVDIELCDQEGNVCVKMRGVKYQFDTGKLAERKDEISPHVSKTSEPSLVAAVDNSVVARGHVEKPKGIGLSQVGEVVVTGGQVSVAARKTTRVSLSNLNEDALVEEKGPLTALPVVRQHNHEHGVVSLQITADKENLLSPAVTQALLQAIDEVAKNTQVKVLIITGSAPEFMTGGRAQMNEVIKHKLHEKLAAFPYPVIAAMKGNAIGAGFFVGSLCDFMIGSQESQYYYTYPQGGLFPTEQEDALFAERFGVVQSTELLYSAGTPKGAELAVKGWGCQFVPGAQVEACAHELAQVLAGMPQISLRELKQHLSSKTRECVQQLHVVESTAMVQKTEPAQDVTSPSNLLAVETGEQGVLSVKVLPYGVTQDIASLIEALEALFSQLQERAQYRAIVLSSSNLDFLPIEAASYDSVVPRIQNLLLHSKIPVIAALEFNASDAAWLLSLCCDACIYSDSGLYGCANGRKAHNDVVALLSLRLGPHLAKDILFTGIQYSGRELRGRQPTLTSVPAEQVLANALELATSWSRLNSPAFLNSKHRIRTSLQSLAHPPMDNVQENEAPAYLPDTPTRIPLNSQVIEATVYPTGVLVVKMVDREARNLFSEAIAEGLAEVFQHIEQTPDYKVIVLTGYDSYFASGGTKEGLLAIQKGLFKYSDAPVYEFPIHCKIPVISAMQGHGIGAGWTLGMFSDFVYLSKESVYSTRFMSYGFTPGAGSTLLFPYQFGMELGREFLMTANEYKGNDIYNRGALMPVQPRKQVYESAMELAHQIARLPRATLVALKQHFTKTVRDQLEETYALELAMHDKTFVNNSDALLNIRQKFNQEVDLPSSIVKQEENDNSPHFLHSIKPTLKRLLADELYLEVEKIGDDTPFLELGLDSITGVTWVRKINQEYEIDIPATEIYTHATISALTVYLEEEIAKQGHTARAAAEGAVNALSQEAAQPVQRENEVAVTATLDKPVVSSKTATVDLDNEKLASIQSTLKRLLADELYLEVEKIGDDTPFLELGLDSITGVTWVRKINQEYEIDIPATEIYTHATISALTIYLEEEIAKQGHTARAAAEGEVNALSQEAAQPVQRESEVAVTATLDKPVVSSKTATVDLDNEKLASIQSTLKRLLADELYLEVEKIGDDTPFLELGLDSITGVTWVRKINQEYEIDIPATEIYTHATISALTAYLKEKVGKQEGPTKEAIKLSPDVERPAQRASAQNDQNFSKGADRTAIVKRVASHRQSKRNASREAPAAAKQERRLTESTDPKAKIVHTGSVQKEKLFRGGLAGGVLLPLSARDLDSLQDYVEKLLAYLLSHPETDLASLAYTLQTSQVEMEERLIVHVNSVEEATQSLTNWLKEIVSVD
ncbi:polyketide synthase [Serratia proteamaculans]